MRAGKRSTQRNIDQADAELVRKLIHELPALDTAERVCLVAAVRCLGCGLYHRCDDAADLLLQLRVALGTRAQDG